MNIIDWPAQSPDLNPTVNVWGQMKTEVHARGPSKLEERLRFSKEEWTRSPPEMCQSVKNYNKQLQACFQRKGHTITTRG